MPPGTKATGIPNKSIHDTLPNSRGHHFGVCKTHMATPQPKGGDGPYRRPMVKYDHTPVQRPYTDDPCLRELKPLGYQTSGANIPKRMRLEATIGFARPIWQHLNQ